MQAHLLALNLIPGGCQAVEPTGNVAHARMQPAAPGKQHHGVPHPSVVLQRPGLHHSLQSMPGLSRCACLQISPSRQSKRSFSRTYRDRSCLSATASPRKIMMKSGCPHTHTQHVSIAAATCTAAVSQTWSSCGHRSARFWDRSETASQRFHTNSQLGSLTTWPLGKGRVMSAVSQK